MSKAAKPKSSYKRKTWQEKMQTDKKAEVKKMITILQTSLLVAKC
jgi:hypothetical protein